MLGLGRMGLSVLALSAGMCLTGSSFADVTGKAVLDGPAPKPKDRTVAGAKRPVARF